jgi:drug/metabolite transporter (DMT)-like permease
LEQAEPGSRIARPEQRTMSRTLTHRSAVLVLASVVLMWGLTWVATKVIVQHVAPFWVTGIRCAIGSVVLLGMLLFSGQFVLPRRGDVPVILSITLLHLVAFSTLVNFGLQLVPLGRSIVLGYTVPLWVTPGAAILLGERMTRRQGLGVGLGLAGLGVMFNPSAFDWSDRNALLGNGFLLIAAASWAANILYVRAHRWVSTPFQLTFWQTLLAGIISSIIALFVDGTPAIDWTPSLTGALLFAGVFGTALAYWAMAVANRSLPAVTTSLILLATPVVGVVCSTVFFGEAVTPSLIVAMAMILGGIATGVLSSTSASRS